MRYQCNCASNANKFPIREGMSELNPKIDKVNRDIEKTRERIASAQAKLKELERQKVDM